jgi:hypothetical protein
MFKNVKQFLARQEKKGLTGIISLKYNICWFLDDREGVYANDECTRDILNFDASRDTLNRNWLVANDKSFNKGDLPEKE